MKITIYGWSTSRYRRLPNNRSAGCGPIAAQASDLTSESAEGTAARWR
jgi:hypothetical protein